MKPQDIKLNPDNPRVIKDDKFIGKEEDWQEVAPAIKNGE